MIFTDKELIIKCYEILGDLTPINGDCGLLCNKACCDGGEENNGVFLFPYEVTLLNNADFGTVDYPNNLPPIFRCDKPCDRMLRPLGCRIFPLTPIKSKNGEWVVKIDSRSKPLCPIVKSGLYGLSADFVKAVVRLIRVIAQDPEGEEFLLKWAQIEKEFADFDLGL